MVAGQLVRLSSLVPFAVGLGSVRGMPLTPTSRLAELVLTPGNKRRHRVKIVTDVATGLPVFSAGPDAPTLTGKEVEKVLANFP